MMYKVANKLTPTYMTDVFQKTYSSNFYELRNSTYDFSLPKNKADYFRKSFVYTEAELWNSFPACLKGKKELKEYLYQ